MEIFFTKDEQWLNQWDAFLQHSERGLYNQLSEWIKAYEVYGFDYSFLLAVDQGKIVGGCGVVIAKLSFFSFLTVPCGPVLEVGFENLLDGIISRLQSEAKARKCCCFQLSLPYAPQQFRHYMLDQGVADSVYFSGKEGIAFKYVIPLEGMRLVDLSVENTYGNVVKNYSSNNKRNLGKTKNADLEFRFVKEDPEIEKGYNCFVQNAAEKGYPLRSYAAMAKTLRNYIDKDHAKMACCFQDGNIIGALYVMHCGGRLTYINGGVLKAYQHLNVSNFMHDQLIRYSIEQGFPSYDLSVGGSRGVKQFKDSFGPKLYTFVPTRHWILKPLQYRLFLWAQKYLKPHKTKMAQLLIVLKKFKSKK